MAPSRPLLVLGLLASQCLLAAQGIDCTRQGFAYAPDLKGSKRSVENSWGHCQQRCVDTQGCQYFSYWPDRGCNLQGKDAKPKETNWKWDTSKWIVSGPARCEGNGDLSAGVFILNDKVDSAGKPLKKAKVADVPIKCPGKFKFDGAGTMELVPTGWHDEEAGGNSQAVEVDKDGKHIIKMDGRAYFAETCTAGNYSNEQYQALNLLGKTMRYTTDISGAGCGCNAAMYLVSMRQNTKPSECYDYYCDANNVCGESCHEIDIQEGNMYAWHSTLHTKSDSDGLGKGYGGGDGWDGPRDFEASEYAPQGSCIDTAKPFQVAVSFPVDENRKLQAMVVVLSQGMGELSGALEAGMTPVVSYWSAPDMLWMDGKGDDGKGPCAVDDVKACPAQVKFYDFVLEEIDVAAVPAPAREPEKESSQEPAPEEADRPEENTEEAPTPEPVQEDAEPAGAAQSQEEHPDDEPHEDPCSATRTEDCRYTQCCQDAGMQCFEKDEYWATCQISCEQGSIDRLDKLTSAQGYDHPASPWSCSPLGKRTPGKADPRIVEKADAQALLDAIGEDSEDDGPVAEEAEDKARVDAEKKRAALNVVANLLNEFGGEDQQHAIVMKWRALGASIWSSGAHGVGVGAALLSAAAAAALAGALATCRRARRRRASPRAYEGLDTSAQAELPGGEARPLRSEEPEAAWRLNVQHHSLDTLLEDQPDV